jgi:hypothetical protein
MSTVIAKLVKHRLAGQQLLKPATSNSIALHSQKDR